MAWLKDPRRSAVAVWFRLEEGERTKFLSVTIDELRHELWARCLPFLPHCKSDRVISCIRPRVYLQVVDIFLALFMGRRLNGLTMMEE